MQRDQCTETTKSFTLPQQTVGVVVETFLIITHSRSPTKYQELFQRNKGIDSDLIPALAFTVEAHRTSHVHM